MSVRPGTPGFTILPASQTTGGASGRTYSISNPSQAVLVACHVLWTATATVGTRQPVFIVKDVLGNFIWAGGNATGPTASQAAHVSAGAGAPVSSVGIYFTMVLPVELPIPINAALNILDAANIDANDSLANVYISFAL